MQAVTIRRKISIPKIPASQDSLVKAEDKQRCHIANFAYQDRKIPPRLIISRMHSQTLFPENANIGIFIEKEPISLYIIDKNNKWQKINLTKNRNTLKVLLGIVKSGGALDNNDDAKLLEAFKLDKLDVCPPISRQLFNSNIILPISFDVASFLPIRKHNGGNLSATLELVKKTLNTGKSTILLDDTLQRWNIGPLSIHQIMTRLQRVVILELLNETLIAEFLTWQKKMLAIDVSQRLIKETMELITECRLLCELSQLPCKLWLLENHTILRQYTYSI